MISKLTKETQALIAAIYPGDGKVSSAHTDTLYAQTGPLHDALELVRAKIADVQALRRKADAVEEDEFAYSFFERIKQTGDAAERLARDAANAIDGLRDACFQLDSYAVEMFNAIETREARAAAEKVRKEGIVVISKEEFAHLQERAALGEDAAIARGAPSSIVATPGA